MTCTSAGAPAPRPTDGTTSSQRPFGTLFSPTPSKHAWRGWDIQGSLDGAQGLLLCKPT